MTGIENFIDEKLTGVQIDALENSPPTRSFSIISWGCAATHWTAKILDSHPEIFCVHALNSVWNELGAGPRLDGLPYLRLLASYGYAYAAAGDIHGVSLAAVPALRAKLGNMFEAVVLVREPMARLKSQISLFEQCLYKGWGALTYVDILADKIGENPGKLTTEQRHFIHGVNCLNAIIEENSAGRVYRCEDLTTNHEVLLELVREIGGGKVLASRQWAEAALAMKPINLHASKKREFDSWQHHIIRSLVQPEAWAAYNDLCYAPPAFLNGTA